MRQSIKWVGSGLVLGFIVGMGAFFATAQSATAAPKCNCPNVYPTPWGPCVLVSCSGFDCHYQCPGPG